MKSIQRLSGLRDTKSLHSIGATSIPKSQRSGHLELYVLENEKNRLEKELFALDKRRGGVKKQLDSVNGQLEKLQNEIWKERGAKIANKAPKKPLKTMALSY